MISLANYDGGSGILIDTNVWIDCMDAKSPWHEQAINGVQSASERFVLHTNIIIYTELLVPGTQAQLLDEMLDVFQVARSALPWPCAQLTAAAFKQYRQNRGERTKPMPDFYLGAHAAVANLGVLTRDQKIYQTYFPRLKLVSPS